MTEQYTPTTDEVRRSFVYAESSDFVATAPGTGVDSWARVRAQGDVKVTRVRDGELHKAATAEFDRWLAEVERSAAEKAWAEGYRLKTMTLNDEIIGVLNPYSAEAYRQERKEQ